MTPAPAPPAAGVVLAGGLSRRMGRPKATLPFRGRPLLEHQLATLRSTGASPLLVATRPGIPLPPLPDFPDVRTLQDRWPDAGPLAGIARALEAAPGDWLLVLAVDLPALPADWFRNLRDGCRPGVGRVPLRDGLWEPLAAVYPVAPALAEARARLARRQLRLQDWVAAGAADGWITPHPVTDAEAPLLANWNAPDATPGTPDPTPPTGGS